ncbi:MAG: hypothetical protein IPL46_22530 [Saprospiraceae bacterium]|nr:hypothetical protein [Saprospiraceae bacterium]
MPDNYGVVDYQLFLSSEQKSPLIVGFGGSEGGMVYAGIETHDLRDSLLVLGYHFLAVGYFGTPATPKDWTEFLLMQFMIQLRASANIR